MHIFVLCISCKKRERVPKSWNRFLPDFLVFWQHFSMWFYVYTKSFRDGIIQFNWILLCSIPNIQIKWIFSLNRQIIHFIWIFCRKHANNALKTHQYSKNLSVTPSFGDFVTKVLSRSFHCPKTPVGVVFTIVFIEIYVIFAVFCPMSPHISLRAAVSGNHCASQKHPEQLLEHIHLGEYVLCALLHNISCLLHITCASYWIDIYSSYCISHIHLCA